MCIGPVPTLQSRSVLLHGAEQSCCVPKATLGLGPRSQPLPASSWEMGLLLKPLLWRVFSH